MQLLTQEETGAQAPATTDGGAEPITKDAVLALIVHEGHCSHKQARAFLTWLTRITADAHKEPHIEYQLDYDEWSSPHHGLLDAIMPDDTTSRPDSAHAAIEQYLAPQGGIITIGHTKDSWRNEGDNCVVIVSTVSVVMN